MAQVDPRTTANSRQPTATLAVLYPDIGEPFRSIFLQIMEGIEAGTKLRVLRYPVGQDTGTGEVQARLKLNNTRAIITLGRQGLRAIPEIDESMPIVAGGILSVPDADRPRMTGISLTPDPALLFAQLKNLQPGVRRITVIYNPQQNDWLIKLAREAAKTRGLELVTREARDLGTAARLYEAAFASSDGRRDAIWLPQDATTVDESTILPLVLRESWERNVPVFSSSFLHVKKGALFALYPNNLDLGRALARMAENAANDAERDSGILPLRDVFVAVNLRTASHLGLNIGYQQQRSFDFIFPEP